MRTIVIGVMMYLMVSIIVGTGWGLNLYKLINADFEPPYKTEIIRVAGILPIIGMFTGWMTIGEEEKTTEN